MLNCGKITKNKYVMEPTLTKEELEELKKFEDGELEDKVHFWAKKYTDTTGADHIKSLVSYWASRLCDY